MGEENPVADELVEKRRVGDAVYGAKALGLHLVAPQHEDVRSVGHQMVVVDMGAR